MRNFTFQWTRDQYDADLAELEETGSTSVIDNTFGSGFMALGVGNGDAIYVVNWHEGELSVLGRFVVDRVLDRVMARKEFGDDFDGEELVVSQDGRVTYEVFDAVLNGPELDDEDDDMIGLIEFVTEGGDIEAPARAGDGSVDPEAFHGVREISADTATLFDELLGFEPDQVIGADDSIARRLVSIDYFLDDEGVASVTVPCEAGELLARWRDADLDQVADAVLDDAEQLADVVWAELEQWAAETEVTILADRGNVGEQMREYLAVMAELDHDGHDH
ncbi:MAG TPA: hypothetical protein PLS63_05930 [Microthrixaceae bacterium]|nr:hypothetical protein [Microthrixaceae bacterium]